MKNIAVIGAGLSGISLTLMLQNNFNVKVFGKSRGIGGRMSTRRAPPFTFDHGAQYFKVTNLDFKTFLKPLITNNIIQPWVCRYSEFNGKNMLIKKLWNYESNNYVGVPNMNSIVKYLARDCDVKLKTKVQKIKKNKKKWQIYDEDENFLGEYDWVIFTAPVEQTCLLISKNLSFFSILKSIKMNSCFSIMIGMEKPLMLDFDVAQIKNADIAWLAVNSSKPGRRNDFSLVINSSYDWAINHINTPNIEVLKHLLNVASDIFNKNLSNAKYKFLHKWRYVESIKFPKENYFIDANEKVAACGDWCVNSRVEGAFISSKNLADKLNTL